MFDDIKDQNSSAPNSGQGENDKNKSPENSSGVPNPPKAPSAPLVEDMFADTEKTPTTPSSLGQTKPDQPVKPAVFQPKQPGVPADIPGGMDEEKIKESSFDSKKFMLIGGIVLVVIIVLSGGYYAYSKFFASNGNIEPVSDADVNDADINNEENTNIINEDNNEQPVIPEEPKPVPPPKPKDTDRDGLPDEEEIKLGTNINSPDSDSDGLFDREEVVVYKTDPLNPDTDGDGFMDGEEVQEGYNPKGAGKLYEINN